ncbi:MAG: phosphatase PAP2 family protein [Leptothrix sp. (in: b-proteobacteria)]
MPLVRLICALAACAVAPLAQADPKQRWDALSTGLALGLPALAAGRTLAADDRDGLLSLTLSLGGTYAAAELIKRQHPVLRPDGSDRQSFPSGHTAIAFAAAHYLDVREGAALDPLLRVGVYGAAGLTALARVEAKKHFWKDTVAGGALGYVVSDVATHARGTQVSLLPTPGGFSVTAATAW